MDADISLIYFLFVIIPLSLVTVLPALYVFGQVAGAILAVFIVIILPRLLWLLWYVLWLLWRGAVILFFIAAELFRREGVDEDAETADDPFYEEEPPHYEWEFEKKPYEEPIPEPIDAIAEACTLLGLRKGQFTPEELGRAYKRAIKAAHPDVCGTPDQAVLINGARDAIKNHYRWK